jgi:protein tyrosine phosphatase
MGPEEEFELYDRENSWQRVFQQLHATDAIRKHEYSLHESKRTENRYRNRYRDVIPYDHSRILLQRFDIDYINASLVLADEANRAYILTQGPLPDTSGHFWLMVWEQKSRAVLMLNRIIEKGQVKCHQYYPSGSENEGDDELTFDDVGLKVTYIEERESNANYTVRAFYLTDLASLESREVLQFHYTAWPDFGVPTSPESFLDFLWSVRQSGALDTETNGPPVIHCSAGIGRSGTFCLVDACLVLVEKRGGKMSNIGVLDTLMAMRHYRMGLVQTHDQLRFSYIAIIEGVKRIIHIASHDSGYDNSIKDSVSNRRLPPNVPMDLSSDDDADVDYDIDDESDSPPPIPPRLSRPTVHPPPMTTPPMTKGGMSWKTNGLLNGASDAFIRGSNGIDGQNGEEADVDDEIELVDGMINDDVARIKSRFQPTDVRRRARGERAKNPDEQITRMKRRQQEKEIWPPVRARRSIRLYIFGAAFATLVAIGGYSLYRFYYR